MKIYRIIEAKKKKKKKKRKSHVGEIGPMYVGKNWSGKLDTRLEPAHRIKDYKFQSTDDFPVIEKKS